MGLRKLGVLMEQRMKTSPQPNEPVLSFLLVSSLRFLVSRLPWNRIFRPKIGISFALTGFLALVTASNTHAGLSVSCSGNKVTLRSGEKELARVLIPVKG